VPEAVRREFEDDPRLDDAAWAKLGPVDRYALAKVVSRGKAKRILAAYREIVGHGMTHLDEQGRVRMVDVAPKAPSLRSATAESLVSMNVAAYRALSTNSAPKGEVLATARLAGIMAAKRTSDLIPLCHPLSLTRSEVSLTLRPETREVHIVATVEAMDRTGVEMEALTAASVAGLTVYDMLKSLDRAMTLGPCQLSSKSGGKSGDFRR
jgi:cyclic pyranopterin phosphate synthase